METKLSLLNKTKNIPKFTNQNLRQIGPGVHELRTDIQTDTHTNRDYNFIYIYIFTLMRQLLMVLLVLEVSLDEGWIQGWYYSSASLTGVLALFVADHQLVRP